MKRLGTMVLLAAAACGGDDAAKPAGATFSPCLGDYECATVEVPVDYADASLGTIGIRVLRAPARDPERRLGTIFVNPGGPGQPMVDRLSVQYPLLSALFAETTARFDVVAFDWRGVGQSARVRCVDDALVERVRAADLAMKTPAAEAEIAAIRGSIVAGCTPAEAALLARMNTENAARDLDRLREALGEEKLNYLGFSYGSWLGATYATLFPERVRAMAFDSAVALADDLQADISRQAASYDVAFGRFFAACAADARCPFGGTGDPAAVASRFDALVAKLEAGPLPAGARTLTATDAAFAFADGMRAAEWTKLGADLAAAEKGDASALLARADTLYGRDAAGHYETGLVALVGIACLDQPLSPPADPGAFRVFADGVRAAHPHHGGALLPWALCTEWPFARKAPRVVIDAHAAPPMLVVSSRFDAISSYDQGPALVDRLRNGSHLVTYEGDGHSVSLKSACVREAMTAYFADPAAPPAKTSCAPE